MVTPVCCYQAPISVNSSPVPSYTPTRLDMSPGHPGNPGNPGNPGHPGHPGNPGNPGNLSNAQFIATSQVSYKSS